MICNVFPGTGLINSLVPSIPWASKTLTTTPACSQVISYLGGLQFTLANMWTTLSTSVNLTQQKKISTHLYSPHSNSTGKETQTGSSETHLNGPMTTKDIYQSTPASRHVMNTHQKTLASTTATCTPYTHHTAPVSLSPPYPNQNYTQQIIVYECIGTRD